VACGNDIFLSVLSKGRLHKRAAIGRKEGVGINTMGSVPKRWVKVGNLPGTEKDTADDRLPGIRRRTKD